MESLKPELNLTLNSCRIPVTLNDAWVQFIEKYEPYFWYLTLTFRDYVSQNRVEKQFYRLVRIINETLYGKRYRERGKGVHWVYAIERQKRGVLHIHALIGGDVWKLRRLTFMDVWEKGYTWPGGRKFQGNGFARIEKYDSSLGAKHYLSKYVVKGGELDVFIPRYLREFHSQDDGRWNSLKLPHSIN